MKDVIQELEGMNNVYIGVSQGEVAKKKLDTLNKGTYAYIIEIEPVGVIKMGTAAGAFDVRQRIPVKTCFITRKMTTAVRLGTLNIDKGNLYHFPPKT